MKIYKIQKKILLHNVHLFVKSIFYSLRTIIVVSFNEYWDPFQ